MIVDIAYLANGIEVSYVNTNGGIDIANYKVCDTPYQYPIWQVSDVVVPEYAHIKDYRNLPVTRSYAKRFNQFDLLQFLFNLPKEEQEKLFAYNRPKLFFFDIETEIGNGFPKPDKAEMPINAFSTCDEQCNCVIQTTLDVLKDVDLIAKYPNPTIDQAYEFINDIIQEYMSQHCFQQILQRKPYIRVIQHDNEQQMLHFWVSKILKDCPALSGWNIWGFDIPYIKNRNSRYGIDFSLASPVGRTQFNNGMPMHKFIDDYMTLVDTYDYSIWIKENLRLDYIATRLFGMGKLPYKGTLKELYQQRQCTFLAYNAIDTMVNAMIHAKTDLLSNVLGLSQATNIDMNHCQGPVKQSEGLIMTLFLEQHKGSMVVAAGGPKPTIREFEGGFVKQPFEHFAHKVCCFDYSGLYPSIMRTHNLSPSNYLRRLYDKDEIAQYKANPNYTVSVNNGLYLNDKDYEYKVIQEQLGDKRNNEKHLQFWFLQNHVARIEVELAKRGALKI